MTDNSARWRRLESVVHAALAQPAGERAAFLAEACAGDSEVSGWPYARIRDEGDIWTLRLPGPRRWQVTVIQAET